ncbi:hypothetical protein [Natrononativus amylolyticus]|uniref:hypothetical protein n=1 Tax=Natrononativus amylolyticus TaxID=2963434 RepID=UPI0020CD71E9|nr:hypothetical protein [Natrononativus amylolyticus]
MTSNSHENGTDETATENRSRTDGRTITAGTIVVGTSGCVELSTGSDERSNSSDEESMAHEQLLVPMIDHRPGMTFQVVSQLPAPITVELLRLPDGDFAPVLTQPDRYTGYVVRSTTGDRQIDMTTNVFTEESLEPDTDYTFTTDTQVFSTELNLFESHVRYED